MRTSPITILFLFISSACIDSFTLHPGGVAKLLAVDGMITSAPGPYTVKLFWTSTVVTSLGFLGTLSTLPTPVTGAQVTILDDQGMSETLQELGRGVYKTDSTGAGIQGIPGRTYHVEIVTPDAQKYASVPEFLAPPGTIDSLYFEFKSGEAIVGGVPVQADGFKIYVNAKDNAQNSLLRWNWTGTYKVFSHPELEQIPLGHCCPPSLLPEPCSGYVCADTVWCQTVKQIRPCHCCICYITETPSVPFLSDNVFISNTSFQHYPVAFLPFVARNFLEKYHLEVRQLTVSQSTYQFWKLVQSQINGASNLFQPPIAKIKGNIVDASGNTVLGIFSACGVAQKVIWIYRNDVPFSFEDPLIREHCQALDPTSVTRIPLFWN